MSYAQTSPRAILVAIREAKRVGCFESPHFDHMKIIRTFSFDLGYRPYLYEDDMPERWKTLMDYFGIDELEAYLAFCMVVFGDIIIQQSKRLFNTFQ